MAIVGYLLVSVSIVGYCLGLSIQINESSSYGFVRQKHTLFCSVTPADDISFPISFQRWIKDKWYSVCAVNTKCAEVFSITGYNCGCMSSSGQTKVYNLTIQSLNIADETNWQCQHDNNYSLNVYFPVTSVTLEVSGSTPGSVVVVEGRSVEFTCFIQGAKPAPTTSQVSWYRQDKSGSNFTLPGSPATPTTDDRNTSMNYTYTADRQHHGDSVFCAARNSLMENRSDSDVTSTNKIQLNVQWPPMNPVLSGDCTSIYISSSTPGTCHCSTSDSGNPAGNTSWFQPDGKNTGTDDLVLNTIQREHNNRDYTCRTQNILGSKEIIFTPKLAYPPSRPTLFSDPKQPWLENKGGSLICSLPDSGKGNPAAQIYWIRNGSDVQHVGAKLSLTPTKEDNGVWYKCSAGNLFTDTNGQHRPESNSLQMNVYYAPRVRMLSERHIRVELGKLVILRCTADSNPDSVVFEWRTRTKHLTDSSLFQISSFQQSDEGEYTCSATSKTSFNTSMSGSASVIVTVLESAPEWCYCTNVLETSVDIKWKYDTNKFTRFTVEQRLSTEDQSISLQVSDNETDDKTFSLHISHLKSNSSYHFKIYSSANKTDSRYCLTVCTTLTTTHYPQSSSTACLGSGIGIGLVIGILLICVVEIIILLIFRRRDYTILGTESKNETEMHTYQDVSTDSIQETADRSDHSQEPTTQYECLQSRDAPEYEKLKVSDNRPSSGNVYENTV